jgi:hypothetical protein
VKVGCDVEVVCDVKGGCDEKVGCDVKVGDVKCVFSGAFRRLARFGTVPVDKQGFATRH